MRWFVGVVFSVCYVGDFNRDKTIKPESDCRIGEWRLLYFGEFDAIFREISLSLSLSLYCG